MIKEIKLNGLTTTPSDYLAPDGDLQYALNMVSKEGSLMSPPIPKTLLETPSNIELMYIHESSGYTNYIFWDQTASKLSFHSAIISGVKYSISDYSKLTQLNIVGNEKPKQITSVDNMLCVINSYGLQYYLFGKDNTYIVLPNKLPIPKFTADLKGTFLGNAYKEYAKATTSNEYAIYGEVIASGTIKNSFQSSDNIYAFGSSDTERLFEEGDYKVTMTNSNKKSSISTIHISVLSGNKNGDTITWGTNPIKRQLVIKKYDNNEFTFTVSRFSCQYIGIKFEEDVDDSIEFSVEITKSLEGGGMRFQHDENYNGFATVTAAAKYFIKNKVNEQHKFIYPFHLRLAFRTYDNHYICPTAPVLLIPNTGQCPNIRGKLVKVSNGTAGSYDYYIRLFTSALVCDLRLKIPNMSEYAYFSDIISNVVIAITPPIYSYDQSVEKEEDIRTQIYLYSGHTAGGRGQTEEIIDDSMFSVASIDDKDSKTYLEHDLYNGTYSGYENYLVHLPLKVSADDEINKQNAFYIIKEIPFSDILEGKYNSIQTVELPKLNMDSLVNNTVLPDDFSSLQQYIPKSLYAYNGRLHIANYVQTLFGGWNIGQMVQPDSGCSYYYKAFVNIKQDNNNYTVETPLKISDYNFGNIRYFSYPNINAEYAIIYSRGKNGSSFYKIKIPLKKHELRNESYWFDNYKSLDELEDDWELVNDNAVDPFRDRFRNELLNSTENPYVPMVVYSDRSKYVKISELYNPLIFTNLRTYNFNTPVLALSSAVTALSTGQKGDFDLYIFTESDGVWSLKINNEGGYNKQIPVTSDILTNTDSLCQVDGAVLFASARGLMMISGSKSECISQVLSRVQNVSLDETDLPFMNKLTINDYFEINDQRLDFPTFIQTAHIVYDYRNQRILILNKSYSYAYSLDVGSRLWSMIPINFKYKVNSYPEALIGLSDNSVIDLSANPATDLLNESKQQYGFILTRPFTFGDSNNYKIIDQVRLNGVFNYPDGENQIHMLLYASNDLSHWYMVSSSVSGRISGKSGNAYRFFRLAFGVKVYPSDCIDSVSFSYRIKDENSKLF